MSPPRMMSPSTVAACFTGHTSADSFPVFLGAGRGGRELTDVGGTDVEPSGAAAVTFVANL